ncbi:MAG: tRNA (cytidine(56)-2'-O)-methyltransferase [Candidatus Bathyarchaeota archaeon]|nr:MAG: tRNA (cytidine(56)-2'-O)-methyltransferase [Candidatus Bathyarchaeota archaeon]
MGVHVLRLDHRPARDKRVTSHLILAARAFGASGATYTGQRDPSLEGSIRGVASDWGGRFVLDYAESWRRVVADWKRRGTVVHLTMYGLPLREVVASLRGIASDILVVVGGAKVPRDIFDLADWNVAVTSQPHSEVSALAVFLHELRSGEELDVEFEGARLRVVPRAHGKEVIERLGGI